MAILVKQPVHALKKCYKQLWSEDAQKFGAKNFELSKLVANNVNERIFAKSLSLVSSLCI